MSSSFIVKGKCTMFLWLDNSHFKTSIVEKKQNKYMTVNGENNYDQYGSRIVNGTWILLAEQL